MIKSAGLERLYARPFHRPVRRQLNWGEDFNDHIEG